MNFFIQDAQAAAGVAPQGNDFMSTLFFMAILFGGLWFFMIRPQQKRQKEHQALLGNLGKGDEVVTSGGVLGRVKEVNDQFVTLEIAKGVEIHLQKQAVSAVLPKGTLKNL
ncbi:MAG TPA: preprotein translocase subunit YajC [Gammaproteobacteria bacterium]|nr:preprotein translocase subunit YajC [Gammaproteobacteria bacterium]